jgi:hypothetical protein
MQHPLPDAKPDPLPQSKPDTQFAAMSNSFIPASFELQQQAMPDLPDPILL